MNGFPGFPIELFQVRLADPGNIELPESRLANREACDSQLVDSIPAAIQKRCTLQVGQKTVNGTHRKSRAARNLFRSETVGGLAEKLQKAQSALQSRDVVTAFWMICHRSAGQELAN